MSYSMHAHVPNVSTNKWTTQLFNISYLISKREGILNYEDVWWQNEVWYTTRSTQSTTKSSTAAIKTLKTCPPSKAIQQGDLAVVYSEKLTTQSPCPGTRARRRSTTTKKKMRGSTTPCSCRLCSCPVASSARASLRPNARASQMPLKCWQQTYPSPKALWDLSRQMHIALICPNRRSTYWRNSLSQDR